MRDLSNRHTGRRKSSSASYLGKNEVYERARTDGQRGPYITMYNVDRTLKPN
jgi:hypothetical protein